MPWLSTLQTCFKLPKWCKTQAKTLLESCNVCILHSWPYNKPSWARKRFSSIEKRQLFAISSTKMQKMLIKLSKLSTVNLEYLLWLRTTKKQPTWIRVHCFYNHIYRYNCLRFETEKLCHRVFKTFNIKIVEIYPGAQGHHRLINRTPRPVPKRVES